MKPEKQKKRNPNMLYGDLIETKFMISDYCLDNQHDFCHKEGIEDCECHCHDGGWS